MDWITDKKFLVGVAVGFLVAPRLVSFVRAKMAGSPASA